MEEHRLSPSPHGRRSSDVWGRIGKAITVAVTVAALLAVVGKVWTAGAQVTENKEEIASITARVYRIETIQVDGHYMSCVLFQSARPDDVPASCDLALRRSNR